MAHVQGCCDYMLYLEAQYSPLQTQTKSAHRNKQHPRLEVPQGTHGGDW